MVLGMWEIIRGIRNMAPVFSTTQTEQHMMANGEMIKKMETVGKIAMYSET